MTHLRRLLLAGILWAVAMTALGTEQCDRADKLRAAGDFDQARASYQVLLGKGDIPCAQAGLLALVDSAASAEKLLIAGDIAKAKEDKAAARRAYAAAVLADPTSKKAIDALTQIGGFPSTQTPATSPKTNQNAVSAALLRFGLRDKAVDSVAEGMKATPPVMPRPDLSDRLDPYLPARALADAGMEKDAVAKAQEAAKSSGLPIPHDLVLIAGVEPAWWRWVKRLTSEYAGPAGLIIALVLLGFALTARLRQRVEISDFSSPDVAASVGPSVSDMVRESIARLNPSRPRFAIATVRDTIQPIQIPDVISSSVPALLPLARLLPDIVQQIQRGRVWRLDGRVHAPSIDRGTGLTLTLSRGRKPAAVTLWQIDFDPGAFPKDPSYVFGANDYYRLAQPAAIWLLFQLAGVPR
jgi:hypothetical protein